MFFTGSEKKLESDFPHFCFQDHRWPEASTHARPLEHRTARSGRPEVHREKGLRPYFVWSCQKGRRLGVVFTTWKQEWEWGGFI